MLWLVAQKTVSPQLQWLGVVQFLDKVVVPVGATTGGAHCLVRLWIHVLLHPGWLLDFFDSLRDWVDSAPEVDSRRFSAHMADEEVAVLVVNSGSGMRSTGFACDAPRAVSDVCWQEGRARRQQ